MEWHMVIIMTVIGLYLSIFMGSIYKNVGQVAHSV